MVSDFGEFDTDLPPRSSVFVSYSNWSQSGLEWEICSPSCSCQEATTLTFLEALLHRTALRFAVQFIF